MTRDPEDWFVEVGAWLLICSFVFLVHVLGAMYCRAKEKPMAVNNTAVTAVLNYAVANPAIARTHGWVNKRSGQTITATEDLPELRRQLLAIRHVRPVSFARGWAG